MRLRKMLQLGGIDIPVLKNTLKNLRWFYSTYELLKKQKGKDTSFDLKPSFPILTDRFAEAGTMSGHYFHQDLLIAKKIFTNNPERHLDIGSRIDGFVAHVAVFRKIEIADVRMQTNTVENITFIQADLMKLPENLMGKYDSISSLHAIEHFGLGRYGDAINYSGHLEAIKNITTLLRPGGTFYFSAPMGPQRIEFNAHRVFSISYLLSCFASNYTVKSFSYVDDIGDLYEDADLNEKDITANYGCNYGCAILELTKI